MKRLISMGNKYLEEIEKKMKASGTAAEKLKYKPKPIKKKKRPLIKHLLPIIRKKGKPDLVKGGGGVRG